MQMDAGQVHLGGGNGMFNTDWTVKLELAQDQLLMSDALANTPPKETGHKIFSANGKKPGNNHHRFGGNLMFCDGQIQSSPAEASAPLVIPPGVTLLNPKP